MRRREVLAGLVGAAFGGVAGVRAQPNALPRVAFLHSGNSAPLAFVVTAVRDGLSTGGYADGRNMVFEANWAESDHQRLQKLAVDLVRQQPAVILVGGNAATRAAKVATTTIPIVFLTGNDPVKDGIVNSLSRPGGNLTGVSLTLSALGAKRLELIRELVPRATVIAMLLNPGNPASPPELKELEEAGRKIGLQILPLWADTDASIEAAFATMVEKGAGALVVAVDASFNGRRDQLVALSNRHKLPAIYHSAEFVRAGGLAGYGTNLVHAYREAGIYAGRILKGAKPSDLPILQPTQLELAINLATAKAFGLDVPRRLLVRASEVVE
jgi:putative tryptophan/tyrosine transport system substrate-binding protein